MPSTYTLPTDRPSLTQHLRQQYLEQRQKNHLRTKRALVEPYARPERNINSDFPLISATVATNTIRKVVERRGDRNVPKRYLKAAKWTPEDDLPCGEGYYVIDPDDNKDGWIPVDFDFEALQWGTTRKKSTGQFEITRPAPVDHGL